MELYESTLEWNDAFPWGTTLPLWAGDPEFKEFVRMGEVPFAKMRGREALERIGRDLGFLRAMRWIGSSFSGMTRRSPQSAPMREYLRRLQYCFVQPCAG